MTTTPDIRILQFMDSVFGFGAVGKNASKKKRTRRATEPTDMMLIGRLLGFQSAERATATFS